MISTLTITTTPTTGEPMTFASTVTSSSLTSTTSLPYLAAPADDAVPRDLPAEVRKLLLASTGPLTRDEIQAELGEPHVPLGQIAAALDAVGATVDAEQRWSLRSREDAEKIAARRADVLESLHDFDDPVPASFIWDEDGGEPYDDLVATLDAMAQAGMVEVSGGDAQRYILTFDTQENIVRHGALYVARSTLPELSATTEDRTAFERAAAERFEAERKAKLEAQAERDKLAAFLRDNGQDVAAILSPPEPVTPGPRRDEFMWEKAVEWSDAVELDLRRKEASLRAKLELSKASLESEKARHDGVRKGIEEELGQIKTAIDDRIYIQREQAYREPRWSEGVTLVVRMSDGAILDRQPIAKGAQRVIPGTEAAPSPRAASVAPVRDVEAEATAAAADEQAARADAVREQTAARWLAAAEELLRAFGASGIEWGVDGAAAANSLARKVHGRERGRLPAGYVELARKTIDTLIDDGRAAQLRDSLVWVAE